MILIEFLLAYLKDDINRIKKTECCDSTAGCIKHIKVVKCFYVITKYTGYLSAIEGGIYYGKDTYLC